MALDPALTQVLSIMDQWRPVIVTGANWGPFELGPWELDGIAYRPTGVVAATVKVIDEKGLVVAEGVTVVNNEGDNPATGLNTLSIEFDAENTALLSATCSTAPTLEIRVYGTADADDAGHAIARFPIRVMKSSLPEAVE